MRLAKGGLLTGVDLLSDGGQFFGRKHFLPDGKKQTFFCLQMGEEHRHQVIETAAPVRIHAAFAQADGETFEREDDRGMVVAQLVDKAPVRHALSVIQDPVVDVFAFKMLLNGFLESPQSVGQLFWALFNGRLSAEAWFFRAS